MKRITTTLAATAVAALAAAPGAAQAFTGPTFAPDAHVIPIIQTHADGTATIGAVYTCNAGDVLWASAKQVAGGGRDPGLSAEGSSSISSAWLDTHTTHFTCDGRWRYDTFALDTKEKGTLQPGWAWFQWCLTKEVPGQDEGDLLISKSGWARVV